MLATKVDRSSDFRFFVVLFVLAAFLPDASWAQLSGVVTPSRLIATTRDQVPGMPPGVTFFDDSYLCCAGLGQPVLSQGSKVAFVGVADGPFSIPSVFLGGGGFGLANVTPPAPEPPPVNVPFSVWYLSGPGRVFLDGNTVVFDGTRYDYLCDTEITCSLTQVGRHRRLLSGRLCTRVHARILGLRIDRPGLRRRKPPLSRPAHRRDSARLEHGLHRRRHDRRGTLSTPEASDSRAVSASPSRVTRVGSFEPGIWKQDTTPLGAVATTATEMPGFPGVDFAAFGAPAVGSPAVGSGGPPLSATVVFQGYADFDHQGIYRGSAWRHEGRGYDRFGHVPGIPGVLVPVRRATSPSTASTSPSRPTTTGT